MPDHSDIDKNRAHDLTIEEVKACDIFSHLNEEDALQVIETIKKLSVIMFNFHKKEGQNFAQKKENS